jgi:hypothetical protein
MDEHEVSIVILSHGQCAASLHLSILPMGIQIESWLDEAPGVHDALTGLLLMSALHVCDVVPVQGAIQGALDAANEDARQKQERSG